MRRCGHYLAHRAGAVSSRERMLRLLAERGEMQQSDLVYLLELRSASVSEQLGKLEAQGLVERRRSDRDRRAFALRATDEGRELLARIDADIKRRYGAAFENEPPERGGQARRDDRTDAGRA